MNLNTPFNCCIFLVLSFASLAQSTIFYEENYDNNNKKWSVECTEELLSDVQNGHYKLERFTNSGANVFLNKVHYNTKKDFILETKFRLLSHKGKHGFGIIWDARNNRFTKNFLIRPNRSFMIYSNKKGKFDIIRKWTKSKAINRKGHYNILKVHKIGTNIKYYINGERIYSSNATYPLGSRIGFMLSNQMHIEVDYIKLYQDNWVYDSSLHVVHMTAQDSLTEKENLGTPINSSYCEKSPIISPDGQMLFVTRNNHPMDGEHQKKDKIWYSLKDRIGYWTNLQNIGAPLNNNNHNFVISVSADNNTLYLGNQYKADGSPGGIGMSIAHRSTDGWQTPQRVNIENYRNFHDQVNFFMAANRKILLAAIENEDTYGVHDLFVYFEKNGAYVNRINLGPTINTASSDFSPFLAADNKTLYFASSGHPGYGSADIFMSKRLDDSWTNWSKPQNLGPIVNSSKWDAYYKIPASGDYAYVVSEYNSLGKEDIFRIKLPEDARPEPVVLIHGKVLNAQTNLPVQTDITYYDLATGAEEGIARSSPIDGSYNIILPYGKKYSFLAYKETFYSISDFLDLSKIDHYAEIERDLYLNPLTSDERIPLNNVFFEPEEATLQKASHAELDRLARVLQKNPSLKIDINGLVQKGGKHRDLLSKLRAASVVEYLVKQKGIAQHRLSSKSITKSSQIPQKNTKVPLNSNIEFRIVLDKKGLDK